MRAVLPGLAVYVSCILCQTAVGVWSQSKTSLESSPATDWLVQDRQRLLSWLRTVRVYIYDLNVEGFQSHFSAFDATGPFCGDACQAQYEAPIWGADLCNQGYGQPSVSNAGPLWTDNDDVASTFFLYTRLRDSKYRTYNVNEANLFFVPLLTSLYCREKYKGLQSSCGLQFAPNLAETFWPWLYKQPAFVRSQGRDHFMVLSKTWGRAFQCEPFQTWVRDKYMGPRQHGWESWDWRGVDNMQKLAHANSHPVDAGWKINAHAMPYPSSVHYYATGSNSTVLDALGMGGTANLWDLDPVWQRERDFLASYVGTVWRGVKVKSDYWRMKVLCAEICHASDRCLANVLDAPPQQPGTPRTAWASFLPGHANFGAFARSAGQTDAWLLSRGIGAQFPQLTYLHSTFCLCPQGDGPTRKGVFDAILFGCIPVVFDAETIKYPWYFPRRLLSKIAVFLDSAAVLAGRLDIMSTLRNISTQEVRARKQLLKQLAFSLQFSITDTEHERLQDRGPDAVEVALAGMLRHATGQGVGWAGEDFYQA